MKHWHDECGVFGIWNNPEASRFTYLGLYALQHRGQESAGIVTLTQNEDHQPHHVHHKSLGLVADNFDERALERLRGRAAVGHVRYSTTGQNLLTNAQPLTARIKNRPVAIAHNGNIVNASVLRRELADEGAIFQGTNDTEVVLHILARQGESDLVKGLQQALPQLDGAFSFVLLGERELIAARDPYGFRPLVLGRIKNENGQMSPVIASETCAFDLIGAVYEREIEPGELFWVNDSGEYSLKFATQPRMARCVFEHVYFSRPDSLVFGRSVYESRKSMGMELAKERNISADVVIPVPDSGVPAAIGYSQQSGIPFELGIIRNHYIGRTFIEPKQSIRSFGVKIKLNPQSAILKGKRVIVIDDSLVRGTTSQKIIGLIRQAGAKEVHLCIAAPPTRGPCFYGVDTPTKAELIANIRNNEEIQQFVGADSLQYLSMHGLWKAVNLDMNSFCSACFDLNYPTKLFENVL